MEPILVTGGTGFLASWIIKILLERGYKVHTTTRHEKNTLFLKKLKNADELLTIFTGVDLMEEGSFEEAIKGCKSVIHTAGPFANVGNYEDIVLPSIKGVENILNSCSKNNIEKVVFTSSMIAVYANNNPADYIYSSKDWSNKDKLIDNKKWYPLSKTLSEKLAWEIQSENSFKMAVMNPCMIFGPQLPHQPRLNTSSYKLIPLIDGSLKEIENYYTNIFDVRDVAEAHVFAVLSDINDNNIWGKRFLLQSTTLHWLDIVNIVREVVPEEFKDKVPLHLSSLQPNFFGSQRPHPILINKDDSIKYLNVNYRDPKESIKDSILSSIENGFVSSNQYKPFDI